MPASMISDDSGSSPKVIGKSIAMVGIGPMPGSTPMSVPSMQPISAKPMFCHEAAALKPVARLANRSTSVSPPDRQRLPQRVGENANGKRRQNNGEQYCLFQVHVVPCVGREDREAGGGECEPDLLDQIAERQNGDENEQQRPQLDRLDRRPFDGQ